LRILLIFCILGFASGCVTAQYPHQTIGTIHQDNLLIGSEGISIPLPDGDWKLIDYNVRIYNKGTSFGEGYLIQEKDNIATGLVEFEISLDTIGQGYALSEACGNLAFIHRVSKANYNGREQDCWWIDNEGTKRMSGIADQNNRAWNYIATNNIKMPVEMVSVNYRRASRTRLMHVFYSFNPEITGISPSKYFDSYHSEWSTENLHRDSKKNKFINKLKIWGAEFDPRVSAGFNRRTQ